MAPAQLCAFTRSDPSLDAPDIQYHVMPLSYEGFGSPHPFPAFTASTCVLRPASRGHVKIRSADARAHPAILQNFLAAPEDRRLIVESVRLTRRICAAPALARYAPQEFNPGPRAQTDQEILGFARDNGISVFHPVGTCRMGADPLAVVDARLRVRGLTGLRVVDASIMPTITSGNTCSPVVMIAEKASDMILEDRRRATR
jgi:choline dehydrogenase